MELLVRIVDKKGNATTDDSKRGDVLAHNPDGHAWSNEELGNDAWRIIRCNIPPTFIDAVMSVASGKRRRERSIDFTRLPHPSLYVGTRTRAIIDVDADHLLRTTQKKAMA